MSSKPRFLPALVLLVLVTASGVGAVPNPRREAPPVDIEKSAAAVGSRAPRFTLPSTAERSWTLKEALKKGPAVLVFYRADW